MTNYRKNVGIVVFRQDGKVLLCERIEDYPKRWQFPQGGIDDGEDVLQAALRELEEETSIVSVKHVYSLPYSLKYDFPDGVKAKLRERGINNDGQEQYWCLFFFCGNDIEININTCNPEFRTFEWVDLSVSSHKVVDFKREIYETVVKEFSVKIQDYLKQ